MPKESPPVARTIGVAFLIGAIALGLFGLLVDWHPIAMNVGLAVTAMAAIFASVTWLGNRFPNEQVPKTIAPWRAAVATGVIAMIVGGYSYDIVNDTEHWPFSSYPLYAGEVKDPKVFKRHLVVGINTNGEDIVVTPDMFHPLSGVRLRMAVEHLPHMSPPSRQRMLESLQTLYGRHRDSKPDLYGLRIYHQEWVLPVNQASRPDEQEVVFEFRFDTPL